MLGNRAATQRWVDNLKVPYPDAGHVAVAWQTPYRIWVWKQNELYRQIFEAQMEHLRKVYRRQWYEAYRVNADEYISVYNRTKAAQYAMWEDEMMAEDKKRREEMYKYEARNRLHEKQRDILREYYTKHFFYWFERASERLQSMERMKWVTREQLSQHIDHELNRYVKGKADRYPLNFVGQMPLIEDAEGNIVEAPPHLAHWYNFTEATTGVLASDPKRKPVDPVSMYHPPAAAGEHEDAMSTENISTLLEPYDVPGSSSFSTATATTPPGMGSEDIDPKVYGQVLDEMDSTHYSGKTDTVHTEQSMRDLMADKEISLSKERMGSRRYIEAKRKGSSRSDEDEDEGNEK